MSVNPDDDETETQSWFDALNTPMHAVEPLLYVGNSSAPDDIDDTFSLVICLLPPSEEELVAPLACPTVPRQVYPLADIPSADPVYVGAVLDKTRALIRDTFAQHPTKKILVHCSAGISRSPMVIIDYLMSRDKCTVEEARAKVELARTCIRPNTGFMNILKSRQV